MVGRSIRLALVLFALAPIAGARAATVWTPATTGTGETITAIAPASGGTLVFVTASGHIFHGTTAGFAQSTMSTTQPQGFTDVAMSPDGTKGVAIGGHGGIFTTSNSGVTWSKIATQPNEPNMSCGTSTGASNVPLADNLDSVQFADATTAYITGDNQDILKSTDSGAHFGEVNRILGGGGSVTCRIQNASETFGDSAWVDANDGFFMSTSFGDIFSTNDGLASTISGRIGSSVNSFGQPVALALDPANPQRMWDVAAFGSCGTLCLETTTNGGSVWNAANFDGKEVGFRDVSEAGGTVIAVGDSGDIYTSADGVNFFRQPSPDFPTNNWRAVDVLNATTALVGGAGGHLIVSSTANQTPAPVGAISGPSVLQVGQSGNYNVTFTDSAGFSVPDSSITWSTPGLANQTGSSLASFAFSTPGSHVITVAFRDAGGAAGSASLTVQVTGSSGGGGGGGGGGGTITLPPSGSNPVSTTTGGATITIFRHVTVKGRKGRFIPVVLKTTKPRKFVISLVTIAKKHKRSKTLATLGVTIRSGKHTVHLNVPKSVKSGSYSLVVKIFTTGKHAHRVGRSVKQVFVLT